MDNIRIFTNNTINVFCKIILSAVYAWESRLLFQIKCRLSASDLQWSSMSRTAVMFDIVYTITREQKYCVSNQDWTLQTTIMDPAKPGRGNKISGWRLG